MTDYKKIEEQYQDFIDDLYDTQATEKWDAFWDRWIVCKVKDYWKFVQPRMYLNEKGKPVVWLLNEDPALDAIDSEDVLFEDLVAGCWNGWASSKATEAEIERRLRDAFEKGLKKAKRDELFK